MGQDFFLNNADKKKVGDLMAIPFALSNSLTHQFCTQILLFHKLKSAVGRIKNFVGVD